MGLKLCGKCTLEKEIEDFDSQGKYCKECRAKDAKIYRSKNSERLREKAKLTRLEKRKDPNVIVEDRVRALAYYHKNKKLKIKLPPLSPQQQYQKLKPYYKEYKRTHKQRRNELERGYYTKNRMDPNYVIRKRISNSVSNAIKRFGKSKEGSILSKLPYTIKELRFHLESKFAHWMNWKNFGVYDSLSWDDGDFSTWSWQIDHIIPQSQLLYDSMDHPNFIKCWDLSNLRPRSSKENIIHGAVIRNSK